MSEIPSDLNLPHGSIWPFALAMAAAIVLLGIVTMQQLPAILLLGVFALALVGVGWFREDMHWFDNHVTTGPGVGRAGIVLFIMSEVFIFGSLFATYFAFRQHGVCPTAPACEPVTHALTTVSINTVVLFASGATMHWAHHALRQGHRQKFIWGLILTLVLGGWFLGGQVLEYIELIREGLTLQTHPAGSTFYMLTGTHGFHVFVGLVFIAVVLYRAWFGQFTPERHVAVEAAALYWHFVDLVWVFVFGILYLGLL